MLLFFFFLLGTAAFLEYMSLRDGAEKLSAELSYSKDVVEPGELFDVELKITNQSRMPVPYIRLKLRLPSVMYIQNEDGKLGIRKIDQIKEISLSTWLGPRQSINIVIKAQIDKRGRFASSGIDLVSGDFLGLKEKEINFPNPVEIVCVPGKADIEKLKDISGGFPGSISVNRFIHEDPILTLGYREYTGREPIKQISWKRSAQSGQLMVKQFDYTLEQSVNVILNIADAEVSDIEKSYSVARSVLEQLEAKNIKYAFSTNCYMGSDSGCYVPQGLGQRQMWTILKGLGCAGYMPSFAAQRLFRDSIYKSSGSYGNIVISASQGAEAEALAKKYSGLCGSALTFLQVKRNDD